MKETYSQQDLVDFKPQHNLFVGIDSDGCVFDSMTIKQRIFHAGLIAFWGLEASAAQVRKIAEWVSLYSPWRGLNRFQLVLKIFEELNRAGVARLATDPLAAFVKSGVPLSMSELAQRIDATGEKALQPVLDWSREMSRQIAEIDDMPVFREVDAGLAALRAVADTIVVSQTTEEALVREWRHAELEPFIDVIAGAELGSKAESLTRAAVGRYPLDRILMMGDASGDLEAAREVGCLFFPIIPGEEVASWLALREEGIERFAQGTFAGGYQEDLIGRFNAALSEIPPQLP